MHIIKSEESCTIELKQKSPGSITPPHPPTHWYSSIWNKNGIDNTCKYERRQQRFPVPLNWYSRLLVVLLHPLINVFVVQFETKTREIMNTNRGNFQVNHLSILCLFLIATFYRKVFQKAVYALQLTWRNFRDRYIFKKRSMYNVVQLFTQMLQMHYSCNTH